MRSLGHTPTAHTGTCELATGGTVLAISSTMLSRATGAWMVVLGTGLVAACSSSPSSGGDDDGGASSGSGAGATTGTGSGAGTTGTGGSTAPPPDKPAPGSCQLSEPAFCEDFEVEAPGGVAGPLDEAKWGISRWGHEWENAFKFSPASTDMTFSPHATFCNDVFTNLVGMDSFAICDGVDAAGQTSKQLNEVFHDTGDFAFHSLLARQPFDFAGRTGTIALDVELKFNPFNVGHGWWVEVWVVEDPVPVPYHGAPAVQSFPRNGVGFGFEGFDCNKGAWENSLTRVVVTEDHEIVREDGGGDCFQTAEGVLNHLEIRLSEDAAEVWVSDAGDPTSFRKVGHADDLGLTFNRGYVVVQHSAYNAAKDDGTPSQTYRWDNIGFDGPVLPRARGYEVPDNQADGGQSYGWTLDGSGERFELQDLDLSDMQGAVLNVSYWPYEDNPTLEYRLNDGAWHSFQAPDQPGGYSLHSYSIPIDLGELVDGTNAVDLRAPGAALPIGNIDVTLLP